MEKENQKKITVRGTDPKDNRFFSIENIYMLRKAEEEVVWLLDRGYYISSIMELVGGRYQFSSRQRIAIQRASCAIKNLTLRKAKEYKIDELSGKDINIDAFNFIITLEVALSKGLLIRCMDGTIRDLAGLRGTYRLIDKTYIVLEILEKAFEDLKLRVVNFYIDKPVSNSGKLKTNILEASTRWNCNTNVYIVQNPDKELENMDYVVSSDSIILDKCTGWINLAKYIIEEYITDVDIVNLDISKNVLK